jgi:uncharacterized DUF497 family protein
MFFIWQQDENESHIAKHGIETYEAEYVVRKAKRPYPRRISGTKWLVKGRTMGGQHIQVIYLTRKPEEIDYGLLSPSDRLALEAGEQAVYVIHARELRRGEG